MTSSISGESSLDDTVVVERHLFGLMDVDVAACPNPWPAGSMPADETVWAQLNRVDFRSVGEDHTAAVRLEGWAGTPADPAGDWDTEEVELVLTSGEVQLWTLTGGPSAHTLRVGPPGHRYLLRVSCRGQDSVLELALAGLPVPDGTEQYVLQFQPLRQAT